MCASMGFLTGSPGPGELLLLFVAVLILFGPKRLPEVARKIGKVLNELRRASQDFKDQVMRIEEYADESAEDTGNVVEGTGGDHSVEAEEPGMAEDEKREQHPAG